MLRFKLTLEPVKQGRILPINYQYGFSSWIYKTLHYGDPAFATWLHDHGYMDGRKQFKLFTFSRLLPDKYGINGDRLQLQGSKALFYISFYAEEAIEPFIVGLFKNQEFTIGDKQSKVQFHVSTIEKLPEPAWKTTVTLQCESPLVVSTINPDPSKAAIYLSPENTGYGDLLVKNLITKYLAVMKQSDSTKITFGFSPEVKFTLLGKPRSKVIKIKSGTPEETFIKGYVFGFSLHAPAELIRLGYYAGFGEKNSLGFGYCKML